MLTTLGPRMGGKHTMAQSNVFAFNNSGLGAFLYAEVGTELNGSALTILSVLARLGQDPWAVAATWAKLPRAAIIDRLTQSIIQMPLCPQALVEARITAGRLTLLLPSTPRTSSRIESADGDAATAWLPIALVYVVVILGAAANIVLAPAHTEMVTPSIVHTVDHKP